MSILLNTPDQIDCDFCDGSGIGNLDYYCKQFVTTSCAKCKGSGSIPDVTFTHKIYVNVIPSKIKELISELTEDLSGYCNQVVFEDNLRKVEFIYFFEKDALVAKERAEDFHI